MRSYRPGTGFRRYGLELTDDERRLLINLLTIEIEASKFPLSPRIEALKADQAEAAGEKLLPAPAATGAGKPKMRR